jgi:hypothetical protein
MILEMKLIYLLGIHPLQVQNQQEPKKKVEASFFVFTTDNKEDVCDVVEALAVPHTR